MDAIEKTRNRLVDSLKQLMTQRPLHKISVKDISDHSGVTRQTFYRYFKDRYDCVRWYFVHVADESFAHLDEMSIEMAFMRKFEIIQHDQTFYCEALLADVENSLFHYDCECMVKCFSSIIESKTQHELDFDTSFQVKMYCMGIVGMTFEWVKSGFNISELELTRLIILSMPEKLKQYLKG